MNAIMGQSLIGAAAVLGDAEGWQAKNPATGEDLAPVYRGVASNLVSRACEIAWAAYDSFRESSLSARASFLERIAALILESGEDLVERAVLETGLPRTRIEGERGRTVAQLRMFASVVREGGFIGARIDYPLPGRRPLPRADLRLRHIALGPVAVFGASNFPLAFSVAGGDTASAFAAGCPVIVKAHSAHPGTSELVGRAVQQAVLECGLPEGVFSLLFGSGTEVGAALVANPRIAAVGFTGSRTGGTALMAIAARRPVPIPVYAEMSSINPVYLLPGALNVRTPQLARDFVGSLTLGAGQFCTNPGLVIAVDGPDLQSFIAAATAELSATVAATMLTNTIHRAFCSGTELLATSAAVETLARGRNGSGENQSPPALFAVKSEAFMREPTLHNEVFGAASLLVRCRDFSDLCEVAESLDGQLTAAVHAEQSDWPAVRRLIPTLERKSGRIVVNGFPTGVEVSDAMVHGGPYPSTSDGRSTSVGSLAVQRFLRPVCYQDMPAALLPEALADSNPLQLWRRLNGVMGKH